MKKRIISLLMCGVLTVATLVSGEVGMLLVSAVETSDTGATLAPLTETKSAKAASDVVINATNFPDKVFRAYVKKSFDKNKDGKLSKAEQNKVVNIGFDAGQTKKKLANLKGIEYFVNLESLEVDNAQLTQMDLSKNMKLKYLYASQNKLTTVDLSKNKDLKEVSFWENKLTDIDISKNTKLRGLDCGENELTQIDVRKNPKLRELHCQSNKITSVNGLEKCKEVRILSLYDNKMMTLPNLKNLKKLGTENPDAPEIAVVNWLSFGGNYFTVKELKRKLPKHSLKDKEWLQAQIESQKVRKTGGLKVANSGNRALKLTWKRTPDVLAYRIYRSTSKDGKYKLIKTVKAKDNRSFVDTKLKLDKTYYYKIRAYKNAYGEKVYGAYSEIRSKKVK